MTTISRSAATLILLLTGAFTLQAQEVLPQEPDAAAPAAEISSTSSADAPPATPGQATSTEELVEDAKLKVGELAADVDKNETAQEAASGLLKHIYLLAEKISFPAFHWVAFAIMVAGVVSYSLQLVLAKLVVLSKFSLSFREILSDSLGLVISLIGLVLTTQAAAENSTFTQSPFAVLSATAAGFVVGFIFYRWGQATEVEAVAGRRVQVNPPRR